MSRSEIVKSAVLARVIHTNYSVLVVLDRMGIKLGVGNKTIEDVAELNAIKTEALLLILNLFCNKEYIVGKDTSFDCIPDILTYLKNSHTYFLEEKIPEIQQNIKQLVQSIHDSKSEMIEQFYNNYIHEVNEHMNYENETVFPYVEQLYKAHVNGVKPGVLSTDYGINIYGEHHDNIENVLKDLKNILIRHLPQVEEGNWRRVVLQQIFELESDLFSHTRIEDEVLIPLVKRIESSLQPVMINKGA